MNSLSFDYELWLSLLEKESSSNTSSLSSSIHELYEYIQQWELRASGASNSSSNTNHYHNNNILYSVNDWIDYMDHIDDSIQKLRNNHNNNKTTTDNKVILLLNIMIQARIFIGKRSIYYLPKSYKLWKYIYEFLLHEYKILLYNNHNNYNEQQNDNNNNNTNEIYNATYTILQCMEYAIITLSYYPKIWIVYIQFLLQYPIQVTNVLMNSPDTFGSTISSKSISTTSYHTFVRRTMNRALQSLPITQHLKVWNMCHIIDTFITSSPISIITHSSNNNNNSNNITDTEILDTTTTTNMMDENDTNTTTINSFWPYESMNRILCRYIQLLSVSVSSSQSSSGGTSNNSSSESFVTFLLDYASWCERYNKYGNAAIVYVTLLNSHCSSNNTNSSNSTNSADTTIPTNNTTSSIYTSIINNSNSQLSILLTSQQQNMIFQSFIELIAKHSIDIDAVHIPWDHIIQTSIQQQIQIEKQNQNQQDQIDNTSITNPTTSSTSTMLGMLYTWYASAYIQRNEYDIAMSIYEDGLLHVNTVRDFSIVYSAYISFLEGLIDIYYTMNNDNDDDDDDDEENMNNNDDTGDDNDWDLLLENNNIMNQLSSNMNTITISTTTTNSSSIDDMEMAIARAEHLTLRRPILLNAVKLRQYPNDCSLYLERANLFIESNQIRSAITILEDGLINIINGGTTTPNSSNVGGKKGTKQNDVDTSTTTICDLVLRLVHIYVEIVKDIDSARDVFDRVCRHRSTAIGIINQNELAECWAKWIEFELQHEQYDMALSLSRQSIAGDPLRNKRTNKVRTLNITKSLRLWDLLLDLEESLGTIQTTKDAYNRVLEIKAATVHHVLNFASFLMEHNYYEEALTAYERGIELFNFPHPGAKLLWKAYIDAFIKRYKGTKIERARNIFARCLENCPSEDCAEFYILNGEFEEQYGLTKRALTVYMDMCEKVPVEDMYTAYHILITKTTKYLGVSATRDIYQQAIDKLVKVSPKSVVNMCRDFAQMEISLNQIERARAIYVYGAQSADPRRLPEYWKDWNDFEIAYGNEESFREMLRVKRSVEAAFSTINYNAIGMKDSISNFTNEEAMTMIAAAEGLDYNESMDKETSAIAGFVPSTSNKRPIPSAATTIATLDDVEERVAKLRKVTGMSSSINPTGTSNNIHDARDHDNDDNEIDLDEIDAEIEEAANSDDIHSNPVPNLVNDIVMTKSVPNTVFGELSSRNNHD